MAHWTRPGSRCPRAIEWCDRSVPYSTGLECYGRRREGRWLGQPVGGIVGDRGPERSSEGALQEGEEPGRGGVTNPTLAKGPAVAIEFGGTEVSPSLSSSLS